MQKPLDAYPFLDEDKARRVTTSRSFKMLIYEVNLLIENEIKKDYERWLPTHIEAMLEKPGFVSANWFEVSNDEQTEWVVHYHVKSEDDLERYFLEDAPTMRQQAIDLFGDRFDATRRVLSLKAHSHHAQS